MNEKKFIQKRAWLNPLSSNDTGAISTDLFANSYSVSCNVQIRDCSRQIDLNFDVYSGVNEGTITQRKKKLKLMIDMLQELYDNLDDAYDLHLKLKQEAEEKRNAQSPK